MSQQLGQPSQPPQRPVLDCGALMTVVNDPRADANKNWLWGLGRMPDNSWAEPPPPLDPTRYPNVKLRDLEPYLRIVRGTHEAFLKDRDSLGEAFQRQMLLGNVDDDGGCYLGCCMPRAECASAAPCASLCAWKKHLGPVSDALAAPWDRCVCCVPSLCMRHLGTSALSVCACVMRNTPHTHMPCTARRCACTPSSTG